MRRTAADDAIETLLALRPEGGGWALFSRGWREPLGFLSGRAANAAARALAARLCGRGCAARLDLYDRSDRLAEALRFTPRFTPRPESATHGGA